MLLFTVYDSKTDAYLPLFPSKTVSSAMRSFGEAVNNPETPFNKHPADYTLFQTGSFNEDTGIITPADKGNINLGSALQFMTEQPQQILKGLTNV